MQDILEKYKINNERYFVKSLAKGLAVLQILSDMHQPMTLTDIAQTLGTNRTTATRLCYTLSEMGFITRDKHGSFHPTPKVLTLGAAWIFGLDWRQVAESYLRRLFAEIHETVNLTILDEDETLYVIRIKEPSFFPDIRVGSKLPLHCTSGGKALLAFETPEKIKRILNKLTFQPVTHRTITEKAIFEEELKETKRRGYALTEEEFTLGIQGMAAPILDKAGLVVAAINISVLTSDYSQKRMIDTLLKPLLNTAAEITQAWHQLESTVGIKGYK